MVDVSNSTELHGDERERPGGLNRFLSEVSEFLTSGSPVSTGRMLGTAMISVGLVLFVVGLRILVGLGGDAKAGQFESSTDYGVWSLMLAGTVVLALAVGVLTTRGLLRTFVPLSRGPVIVGVIAYLLVVGTAFGLLRGTGAGQAVPLKDANLKLGVAVWTVLLGGTPIVIGLWLSRGYFGQVRGLVLAAQSEAAQPLIVSTQIDRLSFMAGQDGDAEYDLARSRQKLKVAETRQELLRVQRLQRGQEEVAQLLRVYDFIRGGLTAVSVVIVAAVLTSGALRNALIDGGIATDKSFPESWLLLYGAFFSVLFATMFVPTLMEWRNVAGRLVDEAFPVPEGGRPDADWVDDRDRMQKLLHLDLSISATLTSALGIFAPLLSGAAAVFVSSLKAS